MRSPDLTVAVRIVFAAICIWREARGEDFVAKAGVAWVIRNRAIRGGWWGSDEQEVVTKPWQFSAMTATKDPNLVKWPASQSRSWKECLEVASGVACESLSDPTHGAVYYHDISIPEAPAAWGQVKYHVRLGRLKFYGDKA